MISTTLSLMLVVLITHEVRALSIIQQSRGLLTAPVCTSISSCSRRSYLAVLIGVLSGTTIPWDNKRSVACANASSEDLEMYRAQLLEMIQSKQALEQDILSAIDKMVQLDPSKNAAATLKDDLDGEWKLLWSEKAEAFSPLLILPVPLKPDSYQYLGNAAAREVGSDRVAQGLTSGILGTSQLWLSSGAATAPDDPSVLEIFPPFRLEIGGRYQSGASKTLLLEAGSDAAFRKLNARTKEAQAAPKNRYRQLYLESRGAGSLRISTITDGDPVVVGAIFVHENK